MSKQITILMCSPRLEKSASHSLVSHFSNKFIQYKSKVMQFNIYQTFKKEESKEEMIDSIDKSEILIISTPLYIDSAPYMTIKLMDLISKKKDEGRISEKKRLLTAISCAGFLEYYHNNIALRIYEQFAKRNGFVWAGGFPIGAAGTYVSYPVAELLKMISQLPKEDWRIEYYGKPAVILDEVMQIAAEYLYKGDAIPSEELEKLNIVTMPLEAYAEGGNKNWIGWAEELGTADKLRDKPYEK